MIADRKKIIILGSIIIICLFFYEYSIREKTTTNLILPNIYINNIDFSKKTKNDVVRYFNNKNKLLSNILITAIYKNEPIATFSGQQLNIKFDSNRISDQAFQIGRESSNIGNFINKVNYLFNLKKYNLIANSHYDNFIIQEFINNSEDKYNKPAKNALFKFENGRVISFRTEDAGLKIQSDIFYKDISLLIDKSISNIKNYSIQLQDQIIYPDITLAKANSFGIEELISIGQSDYTHSIPERIHNVILATSKFNGVLIPTNKIFSFNETIGDISSLTGYQPAYIIKNGRTVLGDGGGVCQVSTTLFRAALNAGLPIIERFPHAYRVGYYENDSKPGLDATIFSPTADLKIKNDTPGYILIQTEIDENNNLVYFRLYGKKDKRIAEISEPIIYDVAPPPPALYQDDPTLKKGVIKQIDFPAWGAKVNFKYKVTYPNKTVIEKDFFSPYRPWQAIYLKGTAD